MENQESRAHRDLGALLDFLGLQGSLADVGPLGLRERQDLEDPQGCLAFGVTKDLVAWLGNLGSQVRGDFLGPTAPLDQLGPRVSQVSQVALEDQGWQEP